MSDSIPSFYLLCDYGRMNIGAKIVQIFSLQDKKNHIEEHVVSKRDVIKGWF